MIFPSAADGHGSFMDKSVSLLRNFSSLRKESCVPSLSSFLRREEGFPSFSNSLGKSVFFLSAAHHRPCGLVARGVRLSFPPTLSTVVALFIFFFSV